MFLYHKKIILFILIIIFCAFLTPSCGYKEVQKKYIETQKQLIKLQMKEDKKPLVDIITPDGYKITVRNPYQTNYKIEKPSEHPVYKTAKTFFGLANSNLANILGIGWVSKEIMKQATGDTIGSYNKDSTINTGNTSPMNVTTNNAGSDLSGNDIDKSNNSDNSDSSTNSSNNPDNSDNSDSSTNSYTP